MKNKNIKSASSVKGDNRPLVFAVVLFLIAVPILSQLVTDFFLNIDDDLFFTNNPHLRSLSWENIRSIFTTYYGGNYHPVTTLIEAFEYQMFGLKASGFHTISLLVHLLNGWMVYRLTTHFTDRFEFRAFVTGVFLLHPMHIEPVAWITDKTDLYYTAFFLAALDNYLRYVRHGGMRHLVWTAVLFIASLGCKPAAIAFPFLLWVFDFHFGRGLKRELPFKLALLAVAALFAYVTFTSLDAGSRMMSELMPDYTLVQRFFVANFAFAYYIVSFFLPFGLSALHLAPAELPFHYYLAPFFNAALMYGIYRLQRTDKLVLTGFLFYVFTIGLVVQLVPSGYNVVAERYTYVPYIGIAFSVGALYVYSQSAGMRNRNVNRLLILFSVVLIILSYRRAAEWKDLVTINRSIAEQNGESAYAQLSAGFQELNAGRIEDAMRHVEAAAAIDPENADMHFLKGKVHYQLKDTRSALQSFQQAKQAGSKRSELDGILAVMFFESASYDSAEVYFTQVIAADTANTAANFTNRALCRFNLNRFEDAVSDYTTALAINPALGNARAERGVCYAKLGKKEAACADLRQAVAEGFVDYQPELEENCR